MLMVSKHGTEMFPLNLWGFSNYMHLEICPQKLLGGGGGWTNPSEKSAQVKLDLISLNNMRAENSKNIRVATTKTNG